MIEYGSRQKGERGVEMQTDMAEQLPLFVLQNIGQAEAEGHLRQKARVIHNVVWFTNIL